MTLWQPPVWPDADADRGALFYKHLIYLIPDERDRAAFIDWLAHAVQDPGTRPHSHMLLTTPAEGTGRSWLGALLRRMMQGRHAIEIDLNRIVSGGFNAELSGALFVVANEVRTSADERFSNMERLKIDALPLADSDRRVHVIRCADRPQDEAYYRHLYGSLRRDDFVAGVYASLMTRDLARFNPGARARMTTAKEQMSIAGRTDAQQRAVDLVRACPYPVVWGDDLFSVLMDVTASHSDRQRELAAVQAALREMGVVSLPGKRRPPGANMTRLWVLRDATHWSTDVTNLHVAEANAARLDFERANREYGDVMALWVPE